MKSFHSASPDDLPASAAGGFDDPVRDRRASEAVRDLRDASPRVRDRACWELASVGRRAHAPLLVPLLGDRDLWTRCHAVEAIGRLGARRFAPQVARMLRDASPLARGHALVALGNLRAVRFAPRVARLLEDRRADVRGTAAMALAMLGRRTWIPETVALLRFPTALPHALTALNILKDDRLYRRLRKVEVRAKRADSLRAVLARARIPFSATPAGRKWLRRPFMEFRAVEGYDIYGVFWDVAADFGPGRMGYVVRKGRIVIADMDEAVAELAGTGSSSRLPA